MTRRALIATVMGVTVVALVLAWLGYHLFLAAQESTQGFVVVIALLAGWVICYLWLRRTGAERAFAKFIDGLKKSN